MNENARTDGPQKRLLTPGEAMRCSTDERERIAAAISIAAGEGRIPLEEAEERLHHAYAARYRHELDALVADLPPPTVRGGWATIALMIREQAAADVHRLLGDGAIRRIRIAVVSAVTLLITVLLVLAIVHGIADEGPEFPGGRD